MKQLLDALNAPMQAPTAGPEHFDPASADFSQGSAGERLDLAARLRAAMDKRKQNKTQAAKAIGISVKTVRCALNGAHPMRPSSVSQIEAYIKKPR
jgi:hypothetical protein